MKKNEIEIDAENCDNRQHGDPKFGLFQFMEYIFTYPEHEPNAEKKKWDRERKHRPRSCLSCGSCILSKFTISHKAIPIEISNAEFSHDYVHTSYYKSDINDQHKDCHRCAFSEGMYID
jgi:hypothetical protein